MANLGASLGWGLVIGASLVVGALAAALLRLPERIAATLTAFGGGILLAAIALELVPEADREAGVALTAFGLVAGTALYVSADAWLNRDEDMKMMRRSGHAAAAGRPMTMPAARSETAGRSTAAPAGGAQAGRESAASSPTEAAREAPHPGHAEAARGESIAAGLFVDGVPESIALGLTIAEGELGVALLAGIVIGNVVEAYGAAQPIVAGGHTKRFAVTLLAVIGLALALATVLGGTLLADASGELVGTAQAVAAGAVLAVVTIAIVPHAFDEVSSTVASATVLGFLCGYLLS